MKKDLTPQRPRLGGCRPHAGRVENTARHACDAQSRLGFLLRDAGGFVHRLNRNFVPSVFDLVLNSLLGRRIDSLLALRRSALHAAAAAAAEKAADKIGAHANKAPKPKHRSPPLFAVHRVWLAAAFRP